MIGTAPRAATDRYSRDLLLSRERHFRRLPRGRAAPAFADGRVAFMLGLGLLSALANMSIEPIITMYTSEIVKEPGQVTTVAGLVMSAAALGSIMSASPVGKLADCE
jgi:MFS family permease